MPSWEPIALFAIVMMVFTTGGSYYSKVVYERQLMNTERVVCGSFELNYW